MWNYTWPILIVIFANTFYNICAKSTPEGVQPFAAITVTYITAAVLSVILFFITSENKNLFSEMHNINWTSFGLGLAIVGLEFGYIQVYRAGWNVSIGSLVTNIGLAIVLIFVGLLLYKETISLNQIIGIVLCIAGIIFINK
ncbi:MAG: EamA family transporter [Anaerovorax sp.]|nr:EamA family transporter [Anaerovorax sp.]